MHFTQKMMYMGFGCLLTLAGYILASLANDSVAQSGAEDVTFGEITCRGLTVVDGEGKKRVMLRADEEGGFVGVLGKDGGKATLSTAKHGGIVAAHGKDGGFASLTNTEYGGYVYAQGKDGGLASLANNEYGGAMAVYNKGDKNVLQASVGDMGGGIIKTKDKLGYRTGRLP